MKFRALGIKGKWEGDSKLGFIFLKHYLNVGAESTERDMRKEMEIAEYEGSKRREEQSKLLDNCDYY